MWLELITISVFELSHSWLLCILFSPFSLKLPLCSGCVDAVGMKWLTLDNLILTSWVLACISRIVEIQEDGASVELFSSFIYQNHHGLPFLSQNYRKCKMLTTPLIQSPLNVQGSTVAIELLTCLTFSRVLSKLPAFTDSLLCRARAERRHPQWRWTRGRYWPHQSGSSSKNKTGTSIRLSSIHPALLSDISEACSPQTCSPTLGFGRQ